MERNKCVNELESLRESTQLMPCREPEVSPYSREPVEVLWVRGQSAECWEGHSQAAPLKSISGEGNISVEDRRLGLEVRGLKDGDD